MEAITHEYERAMNQNWRSLDLAAAYPYYLLNLCPPEELPWIAINDLVAGRGGDAVAELAGLTRPTMVEVDELLPRVLEELGIQPVSRRAIFLERCSAIIDDIAVEKIAPYTSSDRLLDIWRARAESLGEEADDLLHSIAFLGILSEDENPHDQIWGAEEILRQPKKVQPFLTADPKHRIDRVANG